MSNGKVLSGGPGIVVLSHVLEVLHINRQAIKLAGLLGRVQANGQLANKATGILPPPLTDLAGKIISLLQSRHERSEKGQIEIRHSANGSDKPVHVRGVGVPDRDGIACARIVLILTEASANDSENHQNNENVI
ncbi:MAG TPA: hypothetical protein VJU54_06360 [Nitrospiraceae bacterium]|nr:hypothetical protein [Nitrospiraceae bacterium]